MPTTGIIEGTDVIIKIGATAVAHTTGLSVSLSKSTRNITTKDSGDDEEHAAMRNSGTISFDGLVAYDATYGYEELLTALEAGTAVSAVWGTFVSGDPQWTRSVILTSLTQDNPLDDNSTFSAEGIMTGDLTIGTTA